MKLIDRWPSLWHRLWSVRLALGGVMFWGAISGLYLAWPAFADALPLWFYAVGGIVMSVGLAIARLLKQPGADV